MESADSLSLKLAGPMHGHASAARQQTVGRSFEASEYMSLDRMTELSNLVSNVVAAPDTRLGAAVAL